MRAHAAERESRTGVSEDGTWIRGGSGSCSVYIGDMSATDICGRLRDWRELYPNPLALTEENAAARADEDKRLGRFAGLDALDREQVIELISWKFQSMAHRKALAMRGVSLERWGGRDGAAGLIRRALANGDDEQALATVCGIYRFGPAMGSVVLAACRPGRFTVADSRALKALRGLGQVPAGPPGFRQGDWLPYLMACRSLAELCGMRLREVDRALWVAANDPELTG
jgi:hypothetical protein